MFFHHRYSEERRRTEHKARSVQHLKDSPMVNAPVGAGRMPQSLVTQARCARPLSLHRTDVVRHLTLRDAPLYWVDAPYCPKSEVHGRSESFSSHNFTTSQNVMLQGIVVLDLGMNTGLLSAKPLGGEPPDKSFPSWERRRIEAEAGRRPWNLKQCQVTSRGNGLPSETTNRMLTRKPSADVDSQTGCHRKDGTGQRTWPGLSWDVRDVESLLFFLFFSKIWRRHTLECEKPVTVRRSARHVRKPASGDT